MGTQYEVHRPTVCLLEEHLFKVDHKIMKESVEGWWRVKFEVVLEKYLVVTPVFLGS